MSLQQDRWRRWACNVFNGMHGSDSVGHTRPLTFECELYSYSRNRLLVGRHGSFRPSKAE